RTHHLYLGQQVVEERPGAGHAAQHREPAGLAPDGLEGGAHAQPSWKHESRLSPSEHPGNSPNPLHRFFTWRAVCRSRPETYVGELPDGGRLEEEPEQVPTVVHQGAIA